MTHMVEYARVVLSLLFSSCLIQAAGVQPDVEQHDFIIVGAGPAGLQWGLLLQAAGVNSYAILERSSKAGSFFQQYPRSRKLISAHRAHVASFQTAEFALRHDGHSLLEAPTFTSGNYSAHWNPTADELVQYLQHVAQGLHIQYGATVVQTTWSEASQLHTVFTEDGAQRTARWLIMATGLRMRDVPACLADAGRRLGLQVFSYETMPQVAEATEPFCRGRPATVFGGGNAAFEAADMLAPCSSAVRLVYRHRPRFAYLTRYVGDVRVAKASVLERYQLMGLDEVAAMDGRGISPQSAFLDALFRARGQDPWDPEQDGGEFVECDEYQPLLSRAADEVVVFAGGFTGARPGLTDVGDGERFPEVDAFWADRGQPRKLYAGALMHGLDFRRSAGGFIAGFRYLVRAQFRHVMRALAGDPWPADVFESVDGALHHAVERVQNSSGLFHMQDVLADVILVHPNGSAAYFPEIPEEWVDEVVPALKNGKGLLVKLAVSDRDAWTHELTFDDSRVGRRPGLYLHPVVVPVLNGALLEACHVMEDPSGEWGYGFMLRDLQFNLLLCHLRLTVEAHAWPMSPVEMERETLVKLQRFAPDAEFEIPIDASDESIFDVVS